MDSTIALIEKAHDGDKGAREQVVQENVGLVWSIVRRFAGRGYELEDLFQIGSIGLIKSIDKFDTSFEVKFSTYAVPMITGEIKRFLRDDGLIKVSRSLKEITWKATKIREELNGINGREPTVEEIADEIGVTKEEMVMAMDAVSEVESLSKTIYQNDGSPISLLERMEAKEDGTEELMNQMFVEQLLNTLKEEEKVIIKKRYFEEKTQTQIAAELGVSQVQISRMEKKILQKLRENL